jgi:hypothetical protein
MNRRSFFRILGVVALAPVALVKASERAEARRFTGFRKYVPGTEAYKFYRGAHWKFGPRTLSHQRLAWKRGGA